MTRQAASYIRVFASAAAVALLFAGLGIKSRAQGQARQGEWRHYSGDNGGKKYAPLDQITKANVSQLRVAWRRPQVSAEFAAANPKLRLSTTIDRRRSWWVACSTPPTPSVSWTRSILRPGGRSGRNNRRA